MTLAPFLPRHACARGLSSGPLFRARPQSSPGCAPGCPPICRPQPALRTTGGQIPVGSGFSSQTCSCLFSLVGELSKEVACALISRCSDYRRLTICVAAAIVIIIPPHSHMIDTLLGVTRRHGTCDPLADRATFVLLLVVPVFLCRGVQFVRLHCDVGRAWAWGCLALPGLEALLPKFSSPIRVPVMLVGF